MRGRMICKNCALGCCAMGVLLPNRAGFSPGGAGDGAGLALHHLASASLHPAATSASQLVFRHVSHDATPTQPWTHAQCYLLVLAALKYAISNNEIKPNVLV